MNPKILHFGIRWTSFYVNVFGVPFPKFPLVKLT